MSVIQQETEEYVYGYVLEVLTTGLYPNKLDVIREYVQNSYDSIKDAKNKGIDTDELVQISIKDGNVLIYDTGLGMDIDKINKFLLFGYSEKETNKYTGFRGIGRLAGLSAATDLVVISSKYGDSTKNTLKFEASKMLKVVTEGKAQGKNYSLKELIKKYTSIINEHEDSNKHYTIVELLNVTKDSEVLLDEKELVKTLGQIAPVKFDPKFSSRKLIEQKIREYVPDYFTIDLTVNETPVYKPFRANHGLTSVEYLVVPGPRKERLAFGWYMTTPKSGAISDDTIKGIRARYKGFGIGNEDLLRNELFSPGRRFVHYWWAGEVYALSPDLIPSSARDNFEQNLARDLLYKQLRLYLGDKINKLASTKSDVKSAENDVNKGSKLVNALEGEIRKGVIEPVKRTKVREVTKQLEKIQRKAKKVKKVNPILAKKAEDVAGKLQKLKTELQKKENIVKPTEELRLTGREKVIYEVCIQVITKFFEREDIKKQDVLLRKIYDQLRLKL